jgi:hypothetical protein
MRRVLMLLPLSLLGGCYAAPPPAPAVYSSAPPVYAPQPPVAYAPPPAPYSAGPANPGNCGTPDQPAACPPLPRNPLPYYPANK